MLTQMYCKSSFLLSSINMLWGSLKEPDIVNTKEFEELFSKATLQPKKKPLSDSYEKKAKTKRVDFACSSNSPKLVILS